MSYRFTDTDKWNDAWFSNLEPNEKLLFNYLCDNCDIAGFIEIIFKNWANDIGLTRAQIEGAFKGLSRGFIISESGDCIFLRNFLKHQKNLPLNEKNKAHLGIIYRFKYYSNKFKIEDINEFIEGASKGLLSPSGIGIGIGNGLGKGKKPKNEVEIFDFIKPLTELGVEEKNITEWLKIRKLKKAVNSEIAFKSIKKEIEKSGLTANQCIEKAVIKSWSGFEASWLGGFNKTELSKSEFERLNDI